MFSFNRVSITGLSFVVTGKRFISVPSKLPLKGLIKLENSKFLQISGQDASVFINGLTTIKMVPKYLKKNQTTISAADVNNETILNSINLSQDEINTSNWGILHESEEFDPEEPDELPMRLGIRRDGRFGLLLRANGRIFSDLFIYPSPFNITNDNKDSEPSYLIEILNKNQFKPIQMMLKLHKLRSKVNIKEVNLTSWFYYNDTKEGFKIYDSIFENYFNNSFSKNSKIANDLSLKFISENQLSLTKESISKLSGFAIDDRSDYFGYRIVVSDPNSEPPILNEKILPYESYIERRIQHGIVENSDLGNIATLPFECNIDWMHGINYDKGCYMGQELTIRTWTGNGTARRILPIKFDEKIPDLKDSFEKLELRVIIDDNDILKDEKSNNIAFNPFGSSSDSSNSNSKPVRARRDVGKVGEVLVNDGICGLARIEKRYFDWDKIQTKKVKVVHNGITYMATIDSSIWNS
ncbi:ccr4 associated factor [Pichia californica]|uniref:Ccr4 associated factor n=1 Tax=Pichia californica TaxID=460514 RepID=A0A9P6WMP6_9ASCO|nr:ccr4 associated factor [[Candida] californica]KAG0688942.1 ccr4 associated factor [[Candida] californica]